MKFDFWLGEKVGWGLWAGRRVFLGGRMKDEGQRQSQNTKEDNRYHKTYIHHLIQETNTSEVSSKRSLMPTHSPFVPTKPIHMHPTHPQRPTYICHLHSKKNLAHRPKKNSYISEKLHWETPYRARFDRISERENPPMLGFFWFQMADPRTYRMKDRLQ